MGILDFREICSPNSNHSSNLKAKIGKSNYSEDFEFFAKEFFEKVKKFKIFKHPSKGSDFGMDLGVEEITKDGVVKWLVSCKHIAHTNKSVTLKEENSIIEKVSSWGCDGFIPFYTTGAGSSLSRIIEGAEKHIKVEFYYKDRIERELLSSSPGLEIASRYFPKSMVNHFKNFIQESNEFTEKDVIIHSGKASLSNIHTYIGGESAYKNKQIQQLVKDANIMSNFKNHKPYFNKAIQETISLYPEQFEIINEHEPNVTKKYKPNWDPFSLLNLAKRKDIGKAYFIGSVWSFWDYSNANEIFTDFMILWASNELRGRDVFFEFKKTVKYKERHYIKLKAGLMSIGCLGIILQDRERDISARLFAYANPI